MFHYLYAIVERLPTPWRPPPAGVGARPIVVHQVDGLVVIASPLAAPPHGGPRTLTLHHDVVVAAMPAEAMLPFRFGALVPEPELIPWLRAHGPLVRSTLARLRGCVEMNVKLLRLSADGPASGELRALGERLVERASVETWRYRASDSAGNVGASVAFLLPVAEVPAFLTRIAPVASHAVGAAVVPTGPWPAYSFVPSFDRRPLARAEGMDPPAHRQAG